MASHLQLKSSILLLFLCLTSFALAGRNNLEKFETYAGKGRREGNTVLSFEPDIEKQQTIVDFDLTQRGVRVMNRMRLIIQWLKESNEPSRAVYESVIMELEVPEVGQEASPAILKAFIGPDYKQYRLDGGMQNLNEYGENLLFRDDLEDVLIQNYDGTNNGKSNDPSLDPIYVLYEGEDQSTTNSTTQSNVTDGGADSESQDGQSGNSSDSGNGTQPQPPEPAAVEPKPPKYVFLKSKVNDEGDTIQLTIRFQTQELDRVGVSKVWNKWTFYNDAEKCATVPGTCLEDRLPVDGNDRPFTYTTYYAWIDFYDKQEIETIFWIMLATSFVGILAWPIEVGFGFGMLIYVLIIGVQGYFNVEKYPNGKDYQGDLVNLLVLSGAYVLAAVTLFSVYTLIPITGPVFNIVVMYLALMELERLALPLRVTTSDVR